MNERNFFTDVLLEELYYINGGRANIARPLRDELHCIDDAGNVYIPSSENKIENKVENKTSVVYRDKTETVDSETHIKVNGKFSVGDLSYSGDISIDIKNEKIDVYVNNEHVYGSK